MTTTRRSFLYAMGGTAAMRYFGAELPQIPGGRLGLELYSVRNELKKDLTGTLKTVHEWGFEHVELAGFPAMKPDDTARALRAAGLAPVSVFVDYERFRDDFAGVIRDARVLGVEYLICGWIPHEKLLTRADVDAAIGSFSQWGAAAEREKLRFGYHIHGYEFQAGSGGTLMDVLFNGTDPEHVDYEMDIFWVVRGGGNPVMLLNRYGSRIQLVHLKDIARGTPTNDPTGQAPDEASVTLGTGMIDLPAVLKAAVSAKVKWYFVEDEHPEAVKQISHSLEYLRQLKI